MTTYYLDPEGGNDANAGTSFALRKKSPSTFASFAAGDEVRVMASRPVINLGDGTWTDGNQTVTLAAAKTKNIDTCDTLWTGSANVTVTQSTNIANHKEGTGSQLIGIAAGFTTGVIAFKALGSAVDFSDYTCLSFWLLSQTTNAGLLANGMLTVTLCSDTAGAVPVNTFVIDLGFGAVAIPAATGGWIPIVIDLGVALGSSIQSVAINATADPGTVTNLFIDNLIACKGLGDPAHLSHRCMIGKLTTAEPEYYPIGSINGTAVRLGRSGDGVATTPTYRGTTETVSTFARLPTVCPFGVFKIMTGTAANPITVSGGWDRTAMSAQSDESWIIGQGGNYNFFQMSGDFIHINGIGYGPGGTTASSTFGVLCPTNNTSSSNGGHVWNILGVVGWHYTVNFCLTPPSGYCQATIGFVMWGGATGVSNAGGQIWNKMKIGRTSGANGYGFTVASLTSGGPSSGRSVESELIVGRSDNNTLCGVAGGSGGTPGRVRGCTFDHNTIADVGGLQVYQTLYLDGCSLNSPTAVDTLALFAAVLCTAVGKVASDNRIYHPNYTALTQTAVRHTASGVAWKVTLITTKVTALGPAPISLGKFAVKASVPITLSAWIQRSSTTLSCGIRVRGGWITDTEVSVAGTAAINTWEQVSVTITPLHDGVVELEGWAYGSTGTSAYFDDVSWSL